MKLYNRRKYFWASEFGFNIRAVINFSLISLGTISAQNLSHCSGNSDIEEKPVQSTMTSNTSPKNFGLLKIWVNFRESEKVSPMDHKLALRM